MDNALRRSASEPVWRTAEEGQLSRQVMRQVKQRKTSLFRWAGLPLAAPPEPSKTLYAAELRRRLAEARAQ
eukprot:2890328-Prymnesium_polylepis.1